MDTVFWDDLLRVKKRYAQALEPVCRQWGLTRNELDILLFLANNPAFDRAADIVERRCLAKSHVSLAVQALERRGMMERRYEDGDRRTIHLRLTEQAAQAVRDGQAAQLRFFRQIYGNLTAEELAQGRRLLEKIGDNLKNMEES